MSAPSPPTSVIVVGAGLGGTCFALSLHKRGIPCTIYELRGELDPPIGGSVSLTASGLRILDRLGVYRKIKDHGFQYPAVHFVTKAGGRIGECAFGTAEYPALRIARSVLLRTLHGEALARGIPIHLGKKASAVEERAGDVSVRFADGTSASADLLVAFDGIHSPVRPHVVASASASASGVHEQFTGVTGVQFHSPRAALVFPSPGARVLPMAILAQDGSFMLMPTDARGENVACFAVWAAEEDRTRDGWKAFADTEAIPWLRETYKAWPDPVKSMLASLDPAQIHIWPAYEIPPLPRWHTARVVIAGDAAHAMSPKGGQGAGQAFEDGELLARALALVGTGFGLDVALERWETRRRERLKGVLAFAKRADGGKGRQSWLRQVVKEWALWAVFTIKGASATAWLIGHDTEKVDLSS